MGVLIVALAFPLHHLSCSHFCPQAKHDYVEQFLDFGFIITQILGCLAVAVGGRVESFGSLLGRWGSKNCFGNTENAGNCCVKNLLLGIQGRTPSCLTPTLH